MTTSHEQDEPDGLERQQGRERGWTRTAKIGASGLAVVIGLMALTLIVERRPAETLTQESSTTPRENASTASGTSVAKDVARKADYVLDLNTGATTPLPKAIVRSLAESGESAHYAASSDGSHLAYVGTGRNGHPQIFIAGIGGTGVRQLTHDSRGATSPAWSPDGTRIAYIGYGTGKFRNFFVLDMATGRSRQVTDGVRNVWDSQFTPDGLSLVFTQGQNCCPLLRTVPIAGGKSTVLVRPEEGLRDSGQGSLSPDGSLVTFLGGGSPMGAGTHCGPCRLVANVDGTDRRVISGGCWYTNPAGTWSPDGRRIVCSDDDDGIVVADIATGGVSHVATGRWAIWLDGHTLLVDA